MKSILGIGNALTDILAVLPDDTLLNQFHLPKGSMQHVDMETGDKIWNALKEIGVKYGLTRERVRQIKEKAIRRLRSNTKNKMLKTYLGQ